MEFLKKQKFGFFAYLIVAIMAIITLSVYVSNVNKPYYQDMNTTVLLIMSAAIVLIGVTLVLPQVAKGKAIDLVVDLSRVGTSVLIILAGVMFISMRLESFGYIFGSNLEMGNEEAFTAGSQAILGIVLFVATWFVSIIASFFGIVKKAI